MTLPLKILIADDSALMRGAVRAAVAGVTTDITEATDGAAAVACYRRQQPDWVLMDLRMRPLDGLGATRQIRACFPQAKIVIVTQHDDDFLREAARHAGACGYVVKENLEQLAPLISPISSVSSSNSPTCH